MNSGTKIFINAIFLVRSKAKTKTKSCRKRAKRLIEKFGFQALANYLPVLCH